MASLNSFKCERELTVRGGTYTYYDLKEAEKNGLKGISKLPRSLKVLLEKFKRLLTGSRPAHQPTRLPIVRRAS